MLCPKGAEQWQFYFCFSIFSVQPTTVTTLSHPTNPKAFKATFSSIICRICRSFFLNSTNSFPRSSSLRKSTKRTKRKGKIMEKTHMPSWLQNRIRLVNKPFFHSSTISCHSWKLAAARSRTSKYSRSNSGPWSVHTIDVQYSDWGYEKIWKEKM